MSKRLSLKEQIRHLEYEVEEEVEKAYHTIEHLIQEKWHQKLHRHARHHVHRLRKKPDHHKRAIAFGVSFGVTAVIFVLWYFLSVPMIMNEYRVSRDENNRLRESANPIDEFNAMYEERKNMQGANVIEALE